ncbi:putative glutathione-specific gamma-glutamylcyclotransferase 2 [Chironomus tepperi]|uniref:putative glutathione-specific gamma-glutamylcyclotransferase 2 n=1 Tax=Chironomus tepperi TaxID=113505 RepID=UPI00391F4A98
MSKSLNTELKEIYIFGYGSLMWKNNDFEFEFKIPGFIKGFKRRFYQNSIDHRGVLEKPGRVVTLIKGNDEERVYGIGYKILSEKSGEVLSHLDFREKNGYERYETLFYPIDNEENVKRVIVYVADSSNSSWNPDHDLNNIAKQVFHAVGPSGENIQYVLNLCQAMREYFPNHFHQDLHLFELEHILIRMQNMKHS